MPNVYQALGFGALVLAEVSATTEAKAREQLARLLSGRWLDQWVEAGERVRAKYPKG
jgi:hypothetical protein